MNKDVDDGSALVHIIGGHLADIVQKGQNLCLRQRDLLIFLNSKLSFQFLFFCLLFMHFDYVCCAEGSGGTHAGVALGAMLYMPQTKTVGLMVDSDPFEVITTNIMQETAKLLELDFTPTAENVHLIDMCGPGYAIPSPEGNAAIRMMAENEGLFLDPVYTGKAFAGLVKMAREGQFKPTDNVLYLYSGGAGGLFAIDIELD